VGNSGVFVETFHEYDRHTRNYDSNLQNRPTWYGGQLGARWKMHQNRDDPPPNVVPDLAAAMTQNPRLHVFSANGLYDFATPYFQTVYTLQHLHLAPPLQRNIAYGFYRSGHMIYLNPTALVQYKRDLARWYDGLLAQRR